MATTPRPRLSSITQIAVISAASIGLLLAVSGMVAIVNGTIMPLFGITTMLMGVIAMLLAAGAWQGKRASWSFLLALCGVIALNAFFAAPKVVSMPKIKSVTPDLELQLGREKAEAQIDDENMDTRLQNLGLCILFAAPFVATCVLLAKGRADFERRA